MKGWLVAVGLGIGLAAPAHAEETELSFAYLPAPGAERVTVEQQLGRLTLQGWDRDEVEIIASKHAPTVTTLDRLRVDVHEEGGQIRIRTGVRIGDSFQALPIDQAGIDLTVNAPRHANLHARTWAGDLEVSGFRAGAELASERGAVRVNDVEGSVRTNAGGRQWLTAIHGDVEADGRRGDLEINTVEGDLLAAKVVEGQIIVREARAQVVRLFSAAGSVVLIGSIRPGGRYQLTSQLGDVHLQLRRAPFSVRAQAFEGTIRTSFRVVGEAGGTATSSTLRGDVLGGGASVELTSAKGNVLIDALALPQRGTP